MADRDVNATHDLKRISSEFRTVSENNKPESGTNADKWDVFNIFELVSYDIPEKEAEEWAEQLLIFYAAGWYAVMEM